MSSNKQQAKPSNTKTAKATAAPSLAQKPILDQAFVCTFCPLALQPACKLVKPILNRRSMLGQIPTQPLQASRPAALNTTAQSVAIPNQGPNGLTHGPEYWAAVREAMSSPGSNGFMNGKQTAEYRQQQHEIDAQQYTRRCDEGHPFTFSTPNWWSGCDTCHEWLYDTGIRIGQCNDSNHRHPETDTFREPHGLLHGHLSLEEMNNKLNNNNDHPVRLLMHKALTSSGRKSAPSDCRHNHTCIIHCTELTAISSRTNVYIKVISAIFPLA